MTAHLPPDPDEWDVMAAVLSVPPWDDSGPGDMVCRHCHRSINDPQPHTEQCPYAIMWLMVDGYVSNLRRYADRESDRADLLRSQFGQLSEDIGWNR